MKAAWNGHVNEVECLLTSGAEYNVTDNLGWTALMNAAMKGHVNEVECLLTSGADINVSDNDGRTALSKAALKGHVNVVERLLTSGADINASDNDGQTSLMKAAEKGHVNIVERLLTNGADCNYRDWLGETALMLAAYNGHVNVVELLLTSGADINVSDYDGLTALMKAAEKGHVNVVKCLLSSGADCCVSDNKVMTALMKAAEKGHVKIVKELLAVKAHCNATDKDGFTALLLAAKNNHGEIVDMLLGSGAHSNVSDKDEWTPLMFATRERNYTAIFSLVVFGADCNAQSKDKWTPLLIAADNKDEEAINLLVSFSDARRYIAIQDARDKGNQKALQMLDSMPNESDYEKKSQSILMVATQYNCKNAVKHLLSHGSDCNERDIFGVTALMIAAAHGQHEIVQALLDHDADVTITDRDGETALTAAVKGGSKETVEILLIRFTVKDLLEDLLRDVDSNDQSTAIIEAISSESLINKKDKIGNTPLHYAVRKKNKEIVQLLLDDRSDPDICNKNGDTPLHMAANAKVGFSSGIVQLLVDYGINIDKQNIKGLSALDLYINLVNEVTINDEFKKTVGYLLGIKSKIHKVDCIIEPLKPDEEDVARCEKVTDVLNIKYLGNLPVNSENEDIAQKVSSVMDELCEEIGKINPEFKCYPVLVGSSASGTKIGLPDECDYLIVLMKFSKNASIEKTDTPGLVRIFNHSDDSHLPITLKSKFELIACEAISAVVKNVQKISLVDVEYNKVCLNFHFVYQGEKPYKNLPVSVDVSPAIEICDTESKASTSVLSSTCIKSSCDILPSTKKRKRDSEASSSVSSSDTQQDESNNSPPPLHAVCKPLANSSDKSLWSLSSSQKESCRIKVLPESRKKVLRLTKALMKEECYGKPKVFKDHDSKIDDVNIGNLFNYVMFQPNKIIDGYLLKTAFLHEVQRFSNDGLWKGEENILQRVESILQYISTCCRDGLMPHCMLEDVNVFEGVNVLEEYERKKVEGVPLLYLISLCADAISTRVENNTVPTKRGVVNLDDSQIYDLYLQIRETQMQESRVEDEVLDKAKKMYKFLNAWDEF